MTRFEREGEGLGKREEEGKEEREVGCVIVVKLGEIGGERKWMRMVASGV